MVRTSTPLCVIHACSVAPISTSGSPLEKPSRPTIRTRRWL
jgi:hypothetical protein